DITAANGTKVHVPATPAYIQMTPCPNTTNSPIWGKSQQAVNGTTSVPKSGASSRALGPGLAAYLPQVLLALPFSPRPSATDSSGVTCDPSGPDVIQVDHDNAKVHRLAPCPTFQLKATIPVATRPLQIDITPDGATALV